MKMNKLGYLFGEGVKAIFLHGGRSVGSVAITVLCLIVAGVFVLVSMNVTILVSDLNQTNEIMVYIDESLTDAEARSVGTELNAIANVYEATFITRQEALENFLGQMGWDQATSGVEATDLRHRFRVVLADNSMIAETVEHIKGIVGVADVSAAYELAEGFARMEKGAAMANAVTIPVMLVICLVIISNAVKLAMYDREEEIAIMKMVGATNAFIRLPYVVEGMILGLVSAALAFGGTWFIYDTITGWLAETATLFAVTFMPFAQVQQLLLIGFGAAGFLVGVFGSVFSIGRFMRAK